MFNLPERFEDENPELLVTSPNQMVVFSGGLQKDDDCEWILGDFTKKRCDKAIEYYHANSEFSDNSDAEIILTGGYGRNASGRVKPPIYEREAVLMAEYLMENDVLFDKLRLEFDSTSTVKNVVELVERGLIDVDAFDKENKLLIVSSANHLGRIAMSLKRVGIPKKSIDLLAADRPEGNTIEKIRSFVSNMLYIVLLQMAKDLSDLKQVDDKVAKVMTTIRHFVKK